MENLKFEIIIPYYKRPEMVKNALDSIKNSNNTNWHLTFIDDSGDDNFRETLMNYGFDEEKVTYIPIMMKDDEKVKMGGAIFGKYMNEVLDKSDADIYIPICDDDAILPDYLDNLEIFFTNNPNEVWGYCHVKLYNPNVEHYSVADERSTIYNWSLNSVNLNSHTDLIHPYCRVDASQVVFKISAMKNGNILYAYPQTLNLDADIFMKMFNKYGPCKFTGCYGQYKGWFDNQLGVRHRAGKGAFYE